MGKGLIIGIVAVAVVVSVVVFWGLSGNVTGGVVQEYGEDSEAIVKSEGWRYICEDSDASGGVESSLTERGKVTRTSIGSGTVSVIEDQACRGRRRGDGEAVVKEAVCLASGNYKYKTYECADGTTCIDGVCVTQE
jgi:hypothetical protein